MTQNTRKRQFRTMPIWVARITEVVHVNGKVYANVITKGGKVRTLRMRTDR